MPVTFGRPGLPAGVAFVSEDELAVDLAAYQTAADSRSLTDHRRQLGRDQAAGWVQDVDGLSALTSSGLTTSGEYLAASVGGTDGNAILPMFGTPAGFRASFVVKCTKNTASSKSVVGFTTSAVGTLPDGSTFTFTAGYLQGTGLAIVRENVGAAVVLLADASISDGDEYTVTVSYHPDLRYTGQTTHVLTMYALDSTGARVGNAQSSVTVATFALNNLLIRTNVAAGGLKDVVLSQHTCGAGLSAQSFQVPVYSSGSESAWLWVPDSPNGHVVMALHGHGGTPTETGYTSSSYKPTWDALLAAGYAVAVPAMGGNLWGNTTAQTYVADLHTLLIEEGFEEDLFVWGYSMGGGAAAALISNGDLPIRAAYLAAPVMDYGWASAQAGFTASFAAAYATTAARDAQDPIQRTAASYAGVPMFVIASASDTTVDKTSNADAFVTAMSGSATITTYTATGIHSDTSHFRPLTTVNWFNAHR